VCAKAYTSSHLFINPALRTEARKAVGERYPDSLIAKTILIPEQK